MAYDNLPYLEAKRQVDFNGTARNSVPDISLVNFPRLSYKEAVTKAGSSMVPNSMAVASTERHQWRGSTKDGSNNKLNKVYSMMDGILASSNEFESNLLLDRIIKTISLHCGNSNKSNDKNNSNSILF